MRLVFCRKASPFRDAQPVKVNALTGTRSRALTWRHAPFVIAGADMPGGIFRVLTNVKTQRPRRSSAIGSESASTRDEILAVAAREFAQYGLSGARMERMAAKMAVTKRMIYYYFESKEALYQAVLEKSYHDIRENDSKSSFEDIDPVKAITRMIEETLEHEISHPEFIRLVINENIHHQARFLARAPEIKRANRVVIERLEAILKRGREAGLFRADIDAVEVHMVISAMCVFRIANRHTFKALYGRDLFSPSLRGRVKDLICDTVLRLLAA
jgi:AcrR family transcriptional regulator